MSSIEPAILCILRQRLHSDTIGFQAVRGGSINDTFQIKTTNQDFFCKINSATKFPHLLAKEAEGLRLLEKQGIIRTPKIIDILEIEDFQILLLEWITSSSATPSFWKLFGEKLAALHQVTYPDFGFDADNYMGAVKQVNTPSFSWPGFFIQQRLQPLVLQCQQKQLLTSKQTHLFEQVYEKVPAVFNAEPPALLHGDLWSGNFICSTDEEPVFIDPAVYFGHRSIDLGMTTLFGGFAPAFYDAYHYHYPLPPNHKEQWKIANLYPLLIHLLLFGKTYLPSIERTLNDFQ